jgi:hypothetical protein
MPLERLSADELALRDVIEKCTPEYFAFVQRMLPGDGGRALVAREGISRQAIKRRLDAAAAFLGTELEYLPTGKDQVAFVAVHVSTDAMIGRYRRSPAPAADEREAGEREPSGRPASDPLTLQRDLGELIGPA